MDFQVALKINTFLDLEKYVRLPQGVGHTRFAVLLGEPHIISQPCDAPFEGNV